MSILPNDILLDIESQVNQICRPLFNTTDITYFIFTRFYKDGSHTPMSSNAKWVEHYWSQDYAKKSQIRFHKGVHFWNMEREWSQASKDSIQFFDIDHRVDIVDEGTDYIDLFGFGAPSRKASILEFYANQLGFLRRFIFYFKDKASPLIKSYKNQNDKKIYIPDTKIHLLDKEKTNKIITSGDSVFNQTKHFSFDDTLNIQLSKRELEVLIYVMLGETAPQIGKKMHISDKTVDTHISTIKRKFGVKCRDDMIKLAFSYGVSDIAKDFIDIKRIHYKDE